MESKKENNIIDIHTYNGIKKTFQLKKIKKKKNIKNLKSYYVRTHSHLRRTHHTPQYVYCVDGQKMAENC